MEINRQTENTITEILKKIKESKGDNTDVSSDEVSEFVDKVLNRELSVYLTSVGELNFEPVEIIYGESGKIHKGFVIEPCMMFGRDYFKVLCEERLMKVPAENVTFPNKKEES
ncbi:MAG: hypothetical protein IJI66_01830 [Erysipelotrichaceae bacterium]|nr:hypothetical protein [Erysipelotrichaceae bacterium]